MQMNNQREYEVIIIGAGVVGNGIAYHLSDKKQKNILVIDKGFPLSGTSGATQAWVWVHGKKPDTYAYFTKCSAELYPELERKIGDIEYARTGGIEPFFSVEEMKEAEKMVQSQSNAGIPVELLSREEVLKKEPYFSQNVVGATYSPVDGNVNPFKLLEKYIKANRAHDVTFSFYNEVTGIDKKAGKFVVHTQKGKFTAEKLVLAGGLWTKKLGAFLNVSVPIEKVRGQIIVTEPLKPFIHHTIGGMMRQMQCGPVLIGYSMEKAGYDRRSTLDIIQETAKFGIQYYPDLAKANVVRCFSGIRVIPEDGIPILGKVPQVDQLYIAVTHSGVTLSPLIGTLMSELIMKDTTSISIKDYQISRFSKQSV
ncbi:FAD dependent oxidoreductase [Heyndrickxia coagulans]|uniref:FAD dependent oxidoreductase n=3 Tax=Heyndrickxia TaxID=2837504 RepID=A0A133KBV5_HEYCO|nr:FAD dependent oxidoreductase [Heyndrickxia coagulans]